MTLGPSDVLGYTDEWTYVLYLEALETLSFAPYCSQYNSPVDQSPRPVKAKKKAIHSNSENIHKYLQQFLFSFSLFFFFFEVCSIHVEYSN